MPILSRDADDAAQDKSGGRVVLWLLLGLGLLIGGAYAGAYYAAADKVPRGTTVSGVSIGGHPKAEAAQRLQAGLAERVSGPIELTIDGKRTSVDPDAAGISVDYEASVAEAGGERTWDPVWLWNYFTGGEDLEAEVTVDGAAFAQTVASLDEQFGRAPREGALGFDGGSITTVTPLVGKKLDRTAARDALVSAYLSEDGTTPALTMTQATPEIDQADITEARETFANPAVSGSVTLSFEESAVKLSPADYTGALSLEPVDGKLVPRLDGAKLGELLSTNVVTEGAPVDATVALVGGSPKVIPAQPGVTFDQKQVEAGFLELVAAPEGQRTLTVDAKVAQPDFTTQEARDLQIKERVSTFTTYYPYAEYRNVNIGRAAELVNGTVLKPGETFSLNGTVGERTRANGFTEGYIIQDGILVTDLGGGVSQMATTTFNAMFFAGLEDVEHKPHSFYIDRYPVGREATVAWGSVDLQFRNDTPYGVLIYANVTPATPTSSGVVTVSMYSTKHWNITAAESERYNVTNAKVRRVDTLECHSNEGYGGFEIDVTRYFEPAGANTETREPEVFHTTYTPSDTVICTNPDAVDDVS
ncbi:MAG: VanW family protein [Nocardioides sp.]|uniref:VanW family protein n=1 Tax=Nocardioides sp. TaxID=35761 RepID=UPI00260A22B7|nr:VanW family protein [Nocardioides sp.]MCW2833502.1 VanW family protein [Nocardioides sp.]